ncbi:thyroid transcription factor 1-associated protein 26 [Rhinophrynus dorsalis]
MVASDQHPVRNKNGRGVHLRGNRELGTRGEGPGLRGKGGEGQGIRGRGRGGPGFRERRGGGPGLRGRGGGPGPGARGGMKSHGSSSSVGGERRPGLESKGSYKAKQRWMPQKQNLFEGSAREGQGFALWRKQKIQFEYKKLLRKQRKASVPTEHLYADSYPEHLKHLYLAEEEMMKNQEKKRKRKDDALQAVEEDTPEVPRKKFKKKTSNQKAKEEYERVQQERARKREEAEKNRKKREEAQQLYKQKKMEAYKILSTKTKKGQPNLNLQMEYLLQKIQQKS